MLYVFHGPDTPKALEKARALADSLRAKRPDAAFEEMMADNWNQAALESHLGGQGLFSSKYIVFLNRVAENAEAKEKIVDFIPAMQESDNIFIVLEGKLNAESKRAFEKDAEKMVAFELAEKEKASADGGFNVFALADAFGKGDAFRAWKIYREAIDRGTEPENILGILFWKAKSMAAGSGPMKQTLGRIVTLYHDGHRGLIDLETGVERLLLHAK